MTVPSKKNVHFMHKISCFTFLLDTVLWNNQAQKYILEYAVTC